MKTKRIIASLSAAILAFAPVAAAAAEIHVMSSAGFKAAYLELAQKFEAKTGHHVVNAWGPSMGVTPQAVPNRLARGEEADVIILVHEALDKLATDGKVDGKSETDLAKSLVGAAVRAGAPHPDISNVEAFKRALIDAKSIAVSDSASGVYMITVLYDKLGLGDAVKAKSRMIPADPVGEVVARGEADLGFQQMSELKPVKGIDLLGPIPAEAQKVTTFTAAIATNAKERPAGEALITFLAAPEAADAIRKSGMEPAKGE
ncbi:MAG: substrate-binding domain-containing protein [Methylobacteriaceae bacterium]|nr:substrate-binding domain-containing protein [Methylobacteriaceae bacterium]